MAFIDEVRDRFGVEPVCRAQRASVTIVLAGTGEGDEGRLDLLRAVLAEDGWQERGSGQSPGIPAVRAALAALIRPARLFGLLDPADAWALLPSGLTGLGRATALEALRAVAAGPRTAP